MVASGISVLSCVVKIITQLKSRKEISPSWLQLVQHVLKSQSFIKIALKMSKFRSETNVELDVNREMR